MPVTTRRLGVLLPAALLAGLAVVPPAHAVAGRTQVSTDRDAARPVYDISSDDSGTVFVTDGGQVRLARAPMTPASDEVDLGTRGPGDARLPAWEVSIQDGRVAIPVLPEKESYATRVRWCLVADCPATSTLTVPSGYRYVGNAGDVAVVHDKERNVLGLLPWSGGAMTTKALGTFPAPLGAFGDATGIALWHGTKAAYLARPSLALTTLPGRRAVLSESYVWFSSLGASGDTYSVHRVPRATPGAAPQTVATAQPGFQYEEPIRMAATDDEVAWSLPLMPVAQRRDNPPQVVSFRTLTVGEEPVDAGVVEWSAFDAFEDRGTFLVHRSDETTGRGFYSVPTGTTAAVKVHELPAVPAVVRSVDVSHGRVAYVDDSRPGNAVHARDISGAVPGPETLVRPIGDDVALSGPFVATAKAGPHSVGAYAPDRAYGGRLGQPPSSIGGGGADRVELSGRRGVLRGPFATELTDVVAARTDLRTGIAAGTVFGDYFYGADRNGGIARRDLVTGALRTVRAGTCGGHCNAPSGDWQLSAWGDEVVFAMDLGTAGRVTGLWDATTRETTALPMLDAGWDTVRYRDGLLLVWRAGHGVRLYDLDAGTSATVDPTGTLPEGNGLDDTYVAWVEADGDAVVQPITDFFPEHVSPPVHLNATVPVGFMPPDRFPSTWQPEWIVSEDVAWELTLRAGTADGAVVRTLSGTSSRGEIDATWDGTDAEGDPQPTGWYHWTLTGAAPVKTGRVFLSRDPLPTPVLTAPALVSDVSTNGRFTISWTDVAPDYAQYWVWRGRDQMRPTAVALTDRTSLTLDAKDEPYTYRFEVYVRDPAGRTSAPALATTVTPMDDTAGRALRGTWVRRYDSRLWRGSQIRSNTPGSKWAFTARGDGVWLVGTKGPGYGRYRVTVDGTRSWTYDAYAPATRYRQVLFRLRLTDAVHTVVIEPLATSGRTLVGIDGFAMRVPLRDLR